MKFALVERRADVVVELCEHVKNPAVEPGQVAVGNGVLRRVKVVQVAELIAEGVADAAVRLSYFLDPLLADGDVVSKILRRHPQPDDICAVIADVGLGGLWLGVAASLLAFGDFFAVGVDHEAVRQHIAIRGDTVAGQRQKQRRLKPATVLVAAFKVVVGLPCIGRAGLGTGAAKLAALHEHGARR